MSLIHDALKEMEKPSGQSIPAVGAPSIQVSGNKSGSGWLIGMLTGIAVALGGVAIWWFLSRSDEVPAPVATQMASAAIPAPAASIEPAAVQSDVSSPVVTAPEQQVAGSIAPVMEAASAPVLAEAPAVVKAAEPVAMTRPSSVTFSDSSLAPAPEPKAAPVRKSAKLAKAKPVQVEVAAVPVVQAAPVISPEQLFADFSAAMAARDMARSKSLLGQLSEALSPGSITVLRAQAWYAAGSGDLAGASRMYRELLERLPGDENASLNLASLEARAGRPAEAYALINDVMQRDPDSVPAQRMMKALREGAR